jgi:catechol 2,3-dioxygenase-like lactoylglutathione lyase family enzyme
MIEMKMTTETIAPLGARELVQIALFSRDLDKARIFYRDVLQLPLLFETGGMMFFQLKGLRLLVGLTHGEEQRIGGAVLYFDAPDMAAFSRDLEARGVTFPGDTVTLQRGPAGELRLRAFSDPDGNSLALMGWVAGAE